MDSKRFLKLFKKYLWILILIPVVAATVTYFLCKSLPKQYRSEVQISTGIVDASKQLPSETQIDYYKSSLQFSNIIEKLKMRKIMSILSYKLILHDLEDPKGSFRQYSKKVDSLSAAAKQDVIAAYKIKLLKKESITPLDSGKYNLYEILTSMGYDDFSIDKQLSIYRPDNSDFVNIEFVSENPYLSAFLVNTLAVEFISNYTTDVYSNQNSSITLLDSILRKKEIEMNNKNEALKSFKMRNGVLNLNEQAATVYAQISQYEERKAQAIRDIQANQGALSAINSKLHGNGDPYMGGSAAVDNGAILNLKAKLKVANDQYIDGGFKPGDKKKVDSLQNLLSIRTLRTSDKNVVDPQVSKQSLIQQKLNLDISTAQIRNTIESIDKQLSVLKSQYSTMVPFDAGIQNFEREAEIATKDYMAALDRTNMSRTEQKTGLKLQVAQIGLPGVADPSKTLIYVALAAMASFIFCSGGLVILFLMDNTINTTDQLSSATKAPVLGSLSHINNSEKNIKEIWNDTENKAGCSIHKELLRSLRFEISNQMNANDSKILGITSLVAGEGKTFIASGLAYAYAMTGRKVLLIGGENPSSVKSDSKQLTTNQNFEKFLVSREIQVEDLITRLSKIEDTKSLLEIQNERNLRSGFDLLKTQFDIIIIDINSLANINLAKEWLSLTEKSIAIFESGKRIDDSDQKLVSFMNEQKSFMGWVLNKVKLTEIKD